MDIIIDNLIQGIFIFYIKPLFNYINLFYKCPLIIRKILNTGFLKRPEKFIDKYSRNGRFVKSGFNVTHYFPENDPFFNDSFIDVPCSLTG